MSLLSLHTDILYGIILRTPAAAGSTDMITMRGLLFTCRRLTGLVQANWPVIVRAFTVITTISPRFSIYRFCGLRHRDEDLPAVVDIDGCKWCKYGVIHRDVGPAFVFVRWPSTLCTECRFSHDVDVSHEDYPWQNVIDCNTVSLTDSKIYVYFVWYNRGREETRLRYSLVRRGDNYVRGGAESICG